MRIILDMQGAQTESRFRGIGRYTMSFTEAVLRNHGVHEVFLVLSGLFPHTIEPIRAAFEGLLPQENIRIWHAPGPVNEDYYGNEHRREAAELIREAFIDSLQPDIVHICSLFEGYMDDAVTSIGRLGSQTPVTTMLYDLIPLMNADHYLKPNERYEAYYRRKLGFMKRASALFAISDFTRQEGIDTLGANAPEIIAVSTAIDPKFKPTPLDQETKAAWQQRLGTPHAFLLYTGGGDERKNLPRLMEAYARIPAALRAKYKLILAGKMSEEGVANLAHFAKKLGLKPEEFHFTGYVNDVELVQLYNLCHLYVFPSWHEGFGLPALEAMACGTPVIAANTSSLPEVIGLEDALFDPYDVQAITDKIQTALEDDAFLSKLRTHGLSQARLFSWDATAKRAISAWETIHQAAQAQPNQVGLNPLNETSLIEAISPYLIDFNKKALTRLAFCMAQNASSGIVRQLFVDVSELCQRDSATGVQRVVRSYLKWLLLSPPKGYRVEPVYATREEGYRYAHAFTQHFLGLPAAQTRDEAITWQRGDLFFGLDMQHHVQLAQAPFYQQLRQEGVIVKFLVHDLLPIQLADLFKLSDAKALHEQWLAMIAKTDGVVCVSKATADALDDWVHQNKINRAITFKTAWAHSGADILDAKPSPGLPDDAHSVLETLRKRPSFLCVSTLEPRKRQGQIVEAVEQLWQAGVDINLVLVGQQGWQTEDLAQHLRAHPEAGQRLFWLQGISDEYLDLVYAASTCLIAASLNEGFGLSLIEAARHNVPVIARDIPIFREVAGAHAFYFQGEQGDDLAQALQEWLRLYAASKHPPSGGMNWLTWQQSAEKLKTALVTQNNPRKQLLVDVSELIQRDARSGIQRVVRNILKEWLVNPPEGYRVEPIYASLKQGYRYARQFTQKFIGLPIGAGADEPIDYAPGDVFFALDFQPNVQVAQKQFYQALRRQGVCVQFLVYDLLCVLMPQYFPEGADRAFKQWLEVVAECDGAVCISQSVADDLRTWLEPYKPERERPFKLGWFHLGADVDNANPTQGLPPDAAAMLAQLHHRPSFLMVGTLEPRKGHQQALEAFELLWQEGGDAALVIVGKNGWMVEALSHRLRTHPQAGQRLFWLEGISDEYLEKIYAACTCLIAASYGEGFGLPLIEAAQHKLPILARDIPVFREVAAEGASFFVANTAQDLTVSIKLWLERYRNSEIPRSESISWQTWAMSAQQLKDKIR